MSQTSHELLSRVLELADRVMDKGRIALARRRQAAQFAWQGADYIPCVFGKDVPELAGLPEFDWKVQFHDPAASLYMQMRGQITAAISGSDFVPAVRADTGVINGPTILGAPYDVPAHTKPVINGHVSKQRLAEFVVPDDVSSLGVMPTMIQHTRHHLAALKAAGLFGDRVGLHHCDLQGPFDIAAQAYGHDEIFLDLYQDPAFIHGLMAKSTDIYIKMAKLCKKLAGAPLDHGHANEYWMNPGSVRLCDDSGILVSPKLYADHLACWIGKAMAPFGNAGWIHYCGGVPDGNRPEGLHLHEIYLAIPQVRGVQFTTAHDWPGHVRKLIAAGRVYPAMLPRGKDEALEPYFRRVLELCQPRLGMIFHPVIRQGEHDGAMDLWHKVQDQLWS